jgi:hypothetical protein
VRNSYILMWRGFHVCASEKGRGEEKGRGKEEVRASPTL